MKADTVTERLARLSDLLECQLQTPNLTAEEETLELQYYILFTKSQPHFLDHVWACSVPDMELISLEHQLAMVQKLTGILKIHPQPIYTSLTLQIMPSS